MGRRRAKKAIAAPAPKAKSSAKRPKQQDIVQYWTEYRWLISIVLVCLFLIIPLTFSIAFRSYSADIIVADQWAEDTIRNNLRSQIAAQVNQQFQNLPQANKDRMINEQLEEVLAERGDEVARQVEQTATLFRSRMQDDTGQTYLIAIDPYHHLRYVEDILERGHVGNELADGRPLDDQMYAPVGIPASSGFHHWFGAQWHRFLNLFGDKSSLATFFWVPVLFSALAVVPAFFISWRRAGLLAGFWTAMMIAVHAGFVGRTAGGFADTDAYVVLFPLLTGWLFLEALESPPGAWKRRLSLLGVLGLAFGLFSLAWEWWYFFDIFLIVLLAVLGYFVVRHLVQHREILSFLKGERLRWWLVMFGGFILSTGIFVTIFRDFSSFINGPLNVVSRTTGIKAAVNVGTIWPNVLTTVAELNAPSISAIVQSIGGKMLFFTALMGVLFTMVSKKRLILKDWILLGVGAVVFLFLVSEKGTSLSILTFLFIMAVPVGLGLLLLLWDDREIDVKYAIFLIIWLAASVFTMTKGVRFILLLLPPFAIAIGIAAGSIYSLAIEWLAKEQNLKRLIIAPILFLILCIPLVAPVQEGYRTGYQEVPSMTDAWWNSLTKIKQESEPDAIVNSWWDFGHWFKYVADRAVTFDGASQNTPMAHWIGRVLLTESEQEALGILRMLDCGSYLGVEDVREGLPGNDLYAAIALTKEIIEQSPDEARATLSANGVAEAQIETILNHTHCAPPENYFITSGDMVGKATVWGHFGGWDFRKADAYSSYRRAPRAEAVAGMTEKYGITEETAGSWYDTMRALPNQNQVNAWISPWPGYPVGWQSCPIQDGVPVCRLGMTIGDNGGQRNVLEAMVINQTDLESSSLLIGVYNGQGGRLGVGEAKPTRMIFINETAEEYTFSGSENIVPYAFVVDLRGEQPRVMVTDEANALSTFSKLFFLDGWGMPAFELFSDDRTFTGIRILVWKVDWSMLETYGMA